MAPTRKEKSSDLKLENIVSIFEEPQNATLLAERRRVRRKVDLRLIPVLGALYSISGIDRVNIANARAAGMALDLHMLTGNRYSVALLVFFTTYIVFELPSNLMLRKVGAAKWLTFLAFSWGVTILGAGFAKKWTDMVVIRILIGIFEAGFIPGSIYLLSCWYTRFQLQKRIAAFYALSFLAGAFGNLLAFGLEKMEGVGGVRGWRWIFIIEGLITVVLAAIGYAFIVDFPDKVNQSRRPFLTREEVQTIKDALAEDRGDESGELGKVCWRNIANVLLTWPPYMHGLLFMTAAVGIYGSVFFIQVIVQGMGFKSSIVLLLCAPPYLAAIPYTLIIAYFADKTRLRSPFIIFQALTTLVGSLLIAYSKNNGVRYFGIFLGVAGCNGNLSTMLSWQQNNVRGQSARSVTTALQILFGGIGGIYASLVFQQKDAPRYLNGMWATIATQLFAIVAVVLLHLFHLRANRKADRGEIILEGLSGFRYTY